MEICMKTPCYIVPIRMGTNMADEKYVTKFCYKRVNLFLEELMNIQSNDFLIRELFR